MAALRRFRTTTCVELAMVFSPGTNL